MTLPPGPGRTSARAPLLIAAMCIAQVLGMLGVFAFPALQSLGGFAAASLGSVVTGMLLDITGGGVTSLSWGITFGSMGLAAAMGPVLLYRFQRHLTADPKMTVS